MRNEEIGKNCVQMCKCRNDFFFFATDNKIVAEMLCPKSVAS